MQVGDHVSGGDVFGTVYENSLVDNHRIMVSPRAMGTVTWVAEKGSYNVDVSISSRTPSIPNDQDLPK
jgi:V-type H+-transporting ATPase subunit A